jgi:hypothetical protein
LHTKEFKELALTHYAFNQAIQAGLLIADTLLELKA